MPGSHLAIDFTQSQRHVGAVEGAEVARKGQRQRQAEREIRGPGPVVGAEGFEAAGTGVVDELGILVDSVIGQHQRRSPGQLLGDAGGQGVGLGLARGAGLAGRDLGVLKALGTKLVVLDEGHGAVLVEDHAVAVGIVGVGVVARRKADIAAGIVVAGCHDFRDPLVLRGKGQALIGERRGIVGAGGEHGIKYRPRLLQHGSRDLRGDAALEQAEVARQRLERRLAAAQFDQLVAPQDGPAVALAGGHDQPVEPAFGGQARAVDQRALGRQDGLHLVAARGFGGGQRGGQEQSGQEGDEGSFVAHDQSSSIPPISLTRRASTWRNATRAATSSRRAASTAR